MLGSIPHQKFHFYHLPTRGLANCYFFCLFQCFVEKEYQTESKWNETFARIFFGTNAIQETWSGAQESSEAATRQGGTPHPRGPHRAPPTYFFHLYILLYPKNIQGGHETTFPPQQPAVPVRSHLGAFSGAPPKGESITEGFYINTIASPMMCEQFRQTFGSIVISQMASSLSLFLNTQFSLILLEIYSM